MKEHIYLSPPHMGGQEMEFIQSAFEDNWIAPVGPNIENFERDICNYTGSSFCTAVSSGTAALHLALLILGVKENDEVIAPTLTFSATINPIAYVGATPILVESTKDTWNMCPDTLEHTIKDRLKKGKKVKAIIMVHLYGMPGSMTEIMEVARKYNIPVIEDAAEALGSTYNGLKLGTLGDIGIFSFNGNKIITTSGGGAIVSNQKKHTDRAKFLATQSKEPREHYEHNEIGYNYRMSNISAGIGRGQMQVLAQRVERRREIFQRYKNDFSSIEGLTFTQEPSNAYYSNRWLTTMLVDPKSTETSRLKIGATLNNSNIESRPIWKPMHCQPVFKNAPYYGNRISEILFSQGICLPSGSALSEHQISQIIHLIKDCCKT